MTDITTLSIQIVTRRFSFVAHVRGGADAAGTVGLRVIGVAQRIFFARFGALLWARGGRSVFVVEGTVDLGGVTFIHIDAIEMLPLAETIVIVDDHSVLAHVKLELIRRSLRNITHRTLT